VAIDARDAIQQLLKHGPKTGEELREAYLGSRPDDLEGMKQYDTKYQRLRRALDSMIEEGIIEAPKYHLAGEVADQRYIRNSIHKYVETQGLTRHESLMADIEVESKKRDAILTPRLLVFLKDRLNEESFQIRMLAISSLTHMASKIDETRKRDRLLLRRLCKDYSRRLVEIVETGSKSLKAAALDLLLMLGTPKVIAVIERILTESPVDEFRQLRSALIRSLCQPYDESAFLKNRFLRDHKADLRDRLNDLQVKYSDRSMPKMRELNLFLRAGRP